MNNNASSFSDTPLPPEKPAPTQFSESPLRSPNDPPADNASYPTAERRLRLWPGVLILALQWGAIYLTQLLWPATQIQVMTLFLGPSVGAFLILLWWLFFSRLHWFDRIMIPVACALYGVGMYFLSDPTIGMIGIMLSALPAAMTAWVVWLVVSYPLAWPMRRAGLLMVLVLAWGYFTLIRMDGVDGAFTANMKWRWVPSAEDRFKTELASLKIPDAPTPVKASVKSLVLKHGDWPSFRGLNRDGRLTGVKIDTDWNKNPPKLLWKHKVGPGWSSFAVIGDHLYTQEQWDDKEVVVCYNADTGKIIWVHKDEARFSEAVAGPGPRATPTFDDGKIYTMGAAGDLDCLDAATGKLVWSSNIKTDTGAKDPQWGFSASPLVIQGKVIVFAGGEGKSVAAYEADSGKFAWAAGMGKMSYCSLQRAVVDGVEQVLITTGDGLTAFDPKDGTILWDYSWNPQEGAARVVQPAQVGNADFLVGTGFGHGTRRVHVKKEGDKWDTSSLWTTTKINPYFNDLVIHKDHIYGFDNQFFTCVGLDKGKSKWRARGYGNGQVLLLADQDLLLILGEQGEVALVEANPAEHKELGKFQAIAGKTWNHPVIAHGKLFVRNGEEAACYQLGVVKSGE